MRSLLSYVAAAAMCSFNVAVYAKSSNAGLAVFLGFLTLLQLRNVEP